MQHRWTAIIWGWVTSPSYHFLPPPRTSWPQQGLTASENDVGDDDYGDVVIFPVFVVLVATSPVSPHRGTRSSSDGGKRRCFVSWCSCPGLRHVTWSLHHHLELIPDSSSLLFTPLLFVNREGSGPTHGGRELLMIQTITTDHRVHFGVLLCESLSPTLVLRRMYKDDERKFFKTRLDSMSKGSEYSHTPPSSFFFRLPFHHHNVSNHGPG